MNEIVQLKITLTGSKPSIWRRVLVKRDIMFDELHVIFQLVMGWENEHLYDFETKKFIIGEHEEDDFVYGDRKKLLDSMTTRLESIVPEKKFIYTYDFGDGWRHNILIEKIKDIDEKIKYPMCIGGKLRCPPEDCGGLGGFYSMLEAVKDKNHPEHKESKRWLGTKSYDVELFDINKVNKKLLSLDVYVKEFNEMRDLQF